MQWLACDRGGRKNPQLVLKSIMNDPLYLQVDPNRHGNLKLEVEGELIEVMLETRLVKIDDDVDFVTAPGIINGLINYKYVLYKFLPGI